MAEFLLLDITHVYDGVDLATLVALHGPEIEEKYNFRVQRGDILEVRPDGYWTVEFINDINPKNCVVSVPFVSFEQGVQYMNGDFENMVQTKKRRYGIDPTQLTFDSNKIATIKNMGQLNNLLKDKRNG